MILFFHLRYSDEVLSKFLSVHYAHLTNKRFDVKVDDVQFVGYPVSLKHSPTRRKGKDPKPSGSTFCIINVVFALPVSGSFPGNTCGEINLLFICTTSLINKGNNVLILQVVYLKADAMIGSTQSWQALLRGLLKY